MSGTEELLVLATPAGEQDLIGEPPGSVLVAGRSALESLSRWPLYRRTLVVEEERDLREGFPFRLLIAVDAEGQQLVGSLRLNRTRLSARQAAAAAERVAALLLAPDEAALSREVDRLLSRAVVVEGRVHDLIGRQAELAQA
jgi:hypothetical protein